MAGLWAVFIDITSRIQAEERLRESEKRLHAIMDRAPEAIFIKDRHGRYLFMNEHCARTLNLRRADVIGRNDRELVSSGLASSSEPTMSRFGRPAWCRSWRNTFQSLTAFAPI